LSIKRLDDEDCSLLERIQRGDAQAIASLYDRYATLVYSIALCVLHNVTLAEKVLSDIFLEIWRTPDRFTQIAGSFSPSIAMLARNRAVAVMLHKPVPEIASPYWLSNDQARNMTREEACAAIDQLPAQRRILLERLFFHDPSQSALASQTSDPLESEKPSTISEAVSRLAGTGVEMVDAEADPAFARRRLHVRDMVAHIEGMNRLARVFVESPTNILPELVAAAVDLCGADSAGVTIELKDGTDNDFYRWVAIAGQYSGFGFLNATLPRYPNPCGVTLERNCPQSYRVGQPFFDILGVKAPTVTDGLLLPWHAEETRGTIWIVAHGRDEAFDGEDCRMMQALAKFAATGVRLQQQQQSLVQQARTDAAATLAHRLAHQINNPLQGLMQTVFLFDRGGSEPGIFAQQAMGEALRLSDVVKRLLISPEQN
jgi:DNA-directed RNA polymerase specialized sigma24 family protein